MITLLYSEIQINQQLMTKEKRNSNKKRKKKKNTPERRVSTDIIIHTNIIMFFFFNLDLIRYNSFFTSFGGGYFLFGLLWHQFGDISRHIQQCEAKFIM